MRIIPSIKVGLAGAIVLSGSLVAGGFAWADYAPQSGDVVAVGGDTPQYALSFLADGDYNGDSGFNTAGAYNRLVTFNATADGNGRTGYLNGSTLASPQALNPTVTLRAGEFPVQRVQSSGAALTAFLADTAKNINFIFSSTLPTATQQGAAGTNGWGYLHVVEIGTDAVKIATASTTNAPANLSIGSLLNIYTGVWTTWNQVPGGTSTDPIIPLLPPSSSAIYKTLLADLKSANGGVTPVLAASVKSVEQNDPSAITSLAVTATSGPQDAIVPFSAARLALWNDGYFHTPNTAYPGGGALSAGITQANSAYSSAVTDYVIYRQSDASSATPFEPGGTRNWVQTLFSNGSGTTPLVASAAGQTLIAASGVTPNYVDLGNVSSGP